MRAVAAAIVSPLDRWIPRADIREHHSVVIAAPADVVMRVAMSIDLRDVVLVRAIFWLRAKWMRARQARAPGPGGFVPDLLAMGWGKLAEVPDHLFVAGAFCQPWQAEVVFEPGDSERFATSWPAARVKIAWTLQAEALPDGRTRFASETRAVATDEVARARFLRYWRWARFGIVAIRWLLLPAIRRQAEREARAAARDR